MIDTWPTPWMLSSACRTSWPASAVRARTERGDSIDTKSTGAASGSSLPMTGGFVPSGRSGSTRLTWSRTSCAAMLTSLSSVNVTKNRETPSVDTDRSSSMPPSVLTASSILSVSSDSTSSGAAPGSTVMIEMMGKSPLGKRSTFSLLEPRMPTTAIVRMSTVAKTGRRTEMLASHCMAASLHLRAVAHFGRRFGGDLLAGLDARQDGDHAVGRVGHLNEAILEVIAHDDEDVMERSLVANGGRGHGRQR